MWKKIKNSLIDIMKGKRNIVDVWYFLQGHFREKLYYSKWKFLMRNHIKEQFELRLKLMDKKCFLDGQCKICGCDIPALTLSDKACEGKCYPPMMSKKQWIQFNNKKTYYDGMEQNSL